MFNSLFSEISTEISLFNTNMVLHKLSHQHIFTKFWIVKMASSEKMNIDWKGIAQYPVPVLIDNFLNQYK